MKRYNSGVPNENGGIQINPMTARRPTASDTPGTNVSSAIRYSRVMGQRFNRRTAFWVSSSQLVIDKVCTRFKRTRLVMAA